MVVGCPKCKVRLKVDETKLSPSGSRFKCPRCATVLIVRKPAAAEKKALEKNKILAAHSNPDTLGKIVSMLTDKGYKVVTAADGIDVMVKALKELPFLSIVEVALPKIYGFEVCKRLKMRAETKEMKFILVPSIYDKTKYRRDPVSLYGADEYIEDHDICTQLLDKIDKLRGAKESEKPGEPAETETKQPAAPKPEPTPQPVVKVTEPPALKGDTDERIERAKRLARTIINDIYLYNTAKLDDSLRKNTFYAVFAPELKEGKKLYDLRISQEVRNIGDFYKEAIENFLSAKKKTLS
ncbi:MAG: zinc-ribbon domain-containing protein [Acidobacteriota bacterium]